MPRRGGSPTREELWNETASALRSAGHYAIVIIGDPNDAPGHIAPDAEPILAISNNAPRQLVRDIYLQICIQRRGGDVESGKALARARSPTFEQDAGGAVLYSGGTDPGHRSIARS